MVQSVMRRSKRLPDRRIMHPAREWIGGLAVVLGALILGAGYATYLFITQLQQLEQPTPVDITVVRYEEETITKALDLYRERAAWFTALQEAQGIPLDTSSSAGGSTGGGSVPEATLELE